KSFINLNGKAETVAETVKENTEKANEYYQNWLKTQVDWAKQVWEMNQSWVKNNIPTQDSIKNTTPADWFNMWTASMNNFNNWIQQGMQANQWCKNMQQFNPSSVTDNMKNITDNWSKMFNNYQELLSTTFTDMQKHLQGATGQDVY